MSANILILEDERAIREMLAFCMSQAGYEVEQAATAERVFGLIKDGYKPDLFLVDWMLPGASGIELTKKLKNLRQRDIMLTKNLFILKMSSKMSSMNGKT